MKNGFSKVFYLTKGETKHERVMIFCEVVLLISGRNIQKFSLHGTEESAANAIEWQSVKILLQSKIFATIVKDKLGVPKMLSTYSLRCYTV